MQVGPTQTRKLELLSIVEDLNKMFVLKYVKIREEQLTINQSTVEGAILNDSETALILSRG